MDRLPTEIVAEILRYLVLHDLFALLTVNRVLRDESVSLIYASIRHIHLFSTGPDADLPSLQCLYSLACSKSAASAVRHLAIRGVPWQDASTLQHLSDTMLNMDGLISLDLSGAPSLETWLLPSDTFGRLVFLQRLEAIHVTNASTALDLCNGRSIHSVRIASEMTETDLFALLALSNSSLRQLQGILCDLDSPVDIIRVLRHVSTAAPLLQTLCLEFNVKDASKEILQVFAEDVTRAMSAFNSLVRFSLVVTPMGSTARLPEQTMASELFRCIPSLRYVELQWKAFIKNGTTVTEPDLPWSTRLRTSWAYTALESHIAAQVASAIARKRCRALGLTNPGLSDVDDAVEVVASPKAFDRTLRSQHIDHHSITGSQ